MKKLNLFIFFCCLGSGLFAQLSEARIQFAKGNTLYEIGEFEDAIKQYELSATTAESAELYFNLGNAYFKTSQIPAAILNYERALKLNPSDTDLQYNLKLANSQITDKIEKLPELNISQWWRSFTMSLPIDTWAWIAVGSAFTALFLFLLFFISGVKAIRMLTFYLGLVFIVASAIGYNRASAAQSIVQANVEAVIFTSKVDVKSAPNESGLNVFILHEGTKVRVLQTQGEWINIRISSGNEGWILQSNCELI